MLISYRRRFIFVHVPKVAGWSVREALRPCAVRAQRRTLARRLRCRFGLQSAEEDIDQKFLDSRSLTYHSTAAEVRRALPQEFSTFFTFAFVRNPWDWHVSYYNSVLGAPHLPTHATIAAAGSFERYVEEQAPFQAPCLKAFVVDTDGRCIVDFVGRFESLERDFGEVCRRLGVAPPLTRVNQSPHRPYREYYDARRRRIIEDLHRQDCEYFAYSF